MHALARILLKWIKIIDFIIYIYIYMILLKWIKIMHVYYIYIYMILLKWIKIIDFIIYIYIYIYKRTPFSSLAI